jgi:predicted lipid-binding transport protein (Tim44 family)
MISVDWVERSPVSLQLRLVAAFAVLTIALLAWGKDANARLEGDISISGRDVWAFLSVPSIADSAKATVPLSRVTAAQAAPASRGTLGGLFNRPGLLGGFASGFLGSGLLGLLFGQGLFSGLSSVPSVLGFLLQLALIVLLLRLTWMWWSGRNAPAFAGLSPRQLADTYGRPRHDTLPDAETLENADHALAEQEVTAADSRQTK